MVFSLEDGTFPTRTLTVLLMNAKNPSESKAQPMILCLPHERKLVGQFAIFDREQEPAMGEDSG